MATAMAGASPQTYNRDPTIEAINDLWKKQEFTHQTLNSPIRP